MYAHVTIINSLLTYCNSYTMGCPPVRGDNPRALASGLSYVQVDNHDITIIYPYISVHDAHHEIFHAKIGKMVQCFSIDLGTYCSTQYHPENAVLLILANYIGYKSM